MIDNRPRDGSCAACEHDMARTISIIAIVFYLLSLVAVVLIDNDAERPHRNAHQPPPAQQSTE